MQKIRGMFWLKISGVLFLIPGKVISKELKPYIIKEVPKRIGERLVERLYQADWSDTALRIKVGMNKVDKI